MNTTQRACARQQRSPQSACKHLQQLSLQFNTQPRASATSKAAPGAKAAWLKPACGQNPTLTRTQAVTDGNSSSSSSSSTDSSSTNSGRPQHLTGRRVVLPPPCDLSGADPQARWNAVSLAYLGDAVWEAHLRSFLYGQGSLSGAQLYSSRVAAKANTHAQATCYKLLLSEGWPSAAEVELMRWAANSSSVAPPKHATRQQYKHATALEALVAYLYLTDAQRLAELMDWLLDSDRVAQWRSDSAPQQPPTPPAQQPGGGHRRVRRQTRQ